MIKGFKFQLYENFKEVKIIKQNKMQKLLFQLLSTRAKCSKSEVITRHITETFMSERVHLHYTKQLK